MLKKVLLFICALMVTTTCYAFTGTIDGFRGIQWGDTVEEVNNSSVFESNLELCRGDDSFAVYKARLADPSLCGVDLVENAILYFSYNKLFKVQLSYGCNSDLDRCYYKLVNGIENVWGITYDKRDYYDPQSQIKSKSARWDIGEDYIYVEHSVYFNGSKSTNVCLGTIRFAQSDSVRRSGF